jgi:hypothetical protein
MNTPLGRPSKYDPAFCDQVVELGRLGKSFQQMAAILNTTYTSMQRWCEEHEDFRVALSQAQEYSQAWWEDMCQTHMIEEQGSAKLNASLWSRSMAARFPKTYRESTKQEITGADGASLLAGIQVSFVKSNDTSSSNSEG